MTAGGSNPRIFGRYELEALVGKGGMAEVYRARCLSGPHEGQKVAIKRLLPDLAKESHYVERFVAEADLSRMLHHPSIVEVYEAGTIRDTYFIAMEYIDGRDLGQIVKRCRERSILLPIDFAVFLGVTLLEALAYAHTACSPSGKPLKIVHCDISPSNLFISRVGEIKLGDFGIAKTVALDGMEQESKVWGKVYYVSPEAVAGQITPETDLWAATVTIYELLTGERPFTGKDPDQVIAAIKAAKPKTIRARRPEVSEALDRTVMKGFAAKASQRYPDATAFAEALRPHYNELIGNPLAIAAVVRGLFGA